MTELIFRRFIKNYGDTQNPEVRAAYGKTAGIVGIICNILLFAAKIAAGIFASSVSIIADAVNNLSDASSSVISLAAFKLSSKPADKEHPYGHGRYEYLAGLFVAVMIIVIGAELLKESIRKIINPETVTFTLLSFVILGVSIAVKLWMAVFYRKAGRAINSKTLSAASLDSANDVIATFAVLIGAAISRLWGLSLDGYIGAAVALFIIVSGCITVKETLDPALGKAPDKAEVEVIREKIMRYDGVLGTHDLMIHDYGPGRQFASVHVEMTSEGDALLKHEIIDSIERDFLEKDGIHMIVHYDPVPPESTELGTLREWIACEVRKLDKRITIHDLAMKDGQISLDCIVPEDMEIGDREIERFVKNIVSEKYPECMCDVRIDRSFAEIAR